MSKRKQFDEDLQAAVNWLVGCALNVLEVANSQSDAAARNLDTVAMLTACSTLPGDAPLRIRCTPHVFTFKA